MSKRTIHLICLVLVLGLTLASITNAAPVGTGFTYQGWLSDANNPADGLYDFQFKLFDDPGIVIGNQVGSDVNVPDIDVIEGYFTVSLDFSDVNAFNGDVRWLEISIRPGDLNDPNGYTFLEPRQKITPAPYAIYAKTAGVAQSLAGADGSVTPALYVDNSGRVGIGTIEPEHELEVQGTVRATGGIIAGEGTLYFGVGNLENTIMSDFGEIYLGKHGYEGQGFENIKVGIGTLTPGAYTLNVNGSAYFANDITLASGKTFDGYDISNKGPNWDIAYSWGDHHGLYLPISGKAADIVDNSVTSAKIQDDTIQFADIGQNGASDGQVMKWNGSAWVADNDTVDNLGNHIATQNILLGDHWLSGDGGDEGIYITSGGAVCIGTTFPWAKLTLNGTICISDGSHGLGKVLTSDSFGIGHWQAINSDMITDGQVGTSDLGDNAVTTGKIENRTILFDDIGQNGAANGQVMKWNGSDWAAANDQIGTGDNLGNHIATQNINLHNHWLSGYYGTDSGIFVRSDGHVGIGTNNPAWDLHVVGTIHSTDGLHIDGGSTINGFTYIVGDISVANGYIITGSPVSSHGSGDIVASSDLIADDNVRATSGYIITGSPSLPYTTGDIVSSDDLIADDAIRAGGNIFSDNGYIYTGSPIAGHTTLDIVSSDDLICDDDVWASDNIHAGGNISCGGSKTAVMQTANYGKRKLYCEESTELFFLDRGEGLLVNGEVTISLDPIFEQTVTIDQNHPMRVQITLTSDCNGVYVASKTANSFTVKELMGGTSNATFDWEVAAKRQGYEDTRLEVFEEKEESTEEGAVMRPLIND